jgi:hypothetical protein
MSSGRHDELFKKRQEQLDRQMNADDAARRDEATFRGHYIAWRNTVKAAIAARVRQLENEYPALGQLFVQDVQDDLLVRKSSHPSGSFKLHFDAERHAIDINFRFAGGTQGGERTLSMTHTIRLNADHAGLSIYDIDELDTDAFITTLFDTFMPQVV